MASNLRQRRKPQRSQTVASHYEARNGVSSNNYDNDDTQSISKSSHLSRPELKHRQSSTLLKVCHGDYVEIDDGRLGTVRYIGTPSNKPDIWLGISLSEPSGRHDGRERDIQYWKDKPKHGIFIKPSQITTILKSYELKYYKSISFLFRTNSFPSSMHKSLN